MFFVVTSCSYSTAAWQSCGDRCRGIIVECLADNSPMYLQYSPIYLLSFTPLYSDIFWIDMWMLLTMGWVWQIHWAFVRTSIFNSHKFFYLPNIARNTKISFNKSTFATPPQGWKHPWYSKKMSTIIVKSTFSLWNTRPTLGTQPRS